MTIFDVMSLICGLALFLYGMQLMSESLKKSAGNRLKVILGKMTASPVRGFLLGLGVTALIQSSSATSVMVVGFVNSGTMTLLQSIGVIMGANVGAAVTFWLTGLSGLGGEGAAVSAAIEWLKPSSWMPLLAITGMILMMISKRGKKRDIGAILLGFSILMVGMDLMGSSVSGLKTSPVFADLMTVFKNPILGLLIGTVITAVIQSSAASVGILQSLSTTGLISYATAIPIIMGQNIGTCITAMLSSVSANKNGRRAALIHLLFNVIGSFFWLLIFVLIEAFIDMPFLQGPIDMFGIAGVHTVFKLLSVLLMAPFYRGLEKLSMFLIRDKKDGAESAASKLDDRLMNTPSLAVARATEVTNEMAQLSVQALNLSIDMLTHYDAKVADEIRDLESKVDEYEDELGTYLVKASAYSMEESDSRQITMLLHMIGDFERISDHSVNIVESAEEMRDKKLEFSEEAKRELGVMIGATREIIALSEEAFLHTDIATATKVEPLEQVVDFLKEKIKFNHILRLQKSECTIEHGFVLSDLLTNFERVSDHCSNIAGCVIEISEHDALDMHRYLHDVKNGTKTFDEMFSDYKEKYSLEK